MKNMNLVMKSMDSITKVVVAPSKKLDTTIKKIDSELLIHLNNSIYLSMDPKKSMQLKDTGNSAADRQHNNRMKQKNPFASQSPINLDSRRTVRKLHEGLTPKGRESHVKGFHLDKIVGEEIGGKVGTPVAQSPTKK